MKAIEFTQAPYCTCMERVTLIKNNTFCSKVCFVIAIAITAVIMQC